MKMRRREFLPLAGTAAVACYMGVRRPAPEKISRGPAGTSAVSIQKCRSYHEDLAGKIMAGIQACGLSVKDKRVLLKPNLVEFDSSTVINTDAAVLAAALEVFRSLGAAQVRIGKDRAIAGILTTSRKTPPIAKLSPASTSSSWT